MRTAGLLAILLTLTAPTVAVAQNSVFGVLGIGFPGQPLGVRSRGIGGGLAAFDPRSAVNPAAITGYGRLAATATSGTTLRQYTALDSVADGLRETRFPFGMLGGPIQGSPISFAVSYSTYAERTYELTTSDTISLRGAEIAVEDRVGSDGGIVDLRGAIGVRLSDVFRVGGAVHLLSGSATLITQRSFGSADYASLLRRNQLAFSGVGFSGGFVITPSPRLGVAAAVRTDNHLEITRDSVDTGEIGLPISMTGGVYVAPHPAVAWATTVTWQSWSDAVASLTEGTDEQAFDTWSVATGIEIGGTDIGTSRFPIRLGARYTQLPFSPTSDRPRELSASVGTAVLFANGRATLDVTIERASRKGGGASESAWYFGFGFTVRP